MSKNKLLTSIETKTFELMENLSIQSYIHKMKEEPINFDEVFELNYLEFIKYSLEFLDVKDPEIYKPVYYKYFKKIHEMSELNAVNFMKLGVSNRKEIFNYWLYAKKDFLKDVMDIYSK